MYYFLYAIDYNMETTGTQGRRQGCYIRDSQPIWADIAPSLVRKHTQKLVA